MVELTTGRVAGFEALARLVDDSGRVLLPAQFLDVALESGAVAALDDAGVHMSLDDFGTGWAALTYLRRFLGPS